MLGKTKCGTRADVYPLPNNPYDAVRTPGASSSGDAAAVASGLSAIGIGSDSGAAGAFRPLLRCRDTEAYERPSAVDLTFPAHHRALSDTAQSSGRWLAQRRISTQ